MVHYTKDSDSPSDPNVKLFVTSFLHAAGYLQDPFVPKEWGTRWYRRDKAHLAKDTVRPPFILSSFSFSQLIFLCFLEVRRVRRIRHLPLSQGRSSCGGHRPHAPPRRGLQRRRHEPPAFDEAPSCS